jgi:hypothetical protein
MSIETEQEIRRKSVEAGEPVRESRETREGEKNPELQAAAAMERADVLVKEVKQSKKQMQNIVVHMQQVKQAIKKLRAQLQLAENGDEDPESVKHDKQTIELLKNKIKEHTSEIEKMRGDLIREQIEELRVGEGAGMTEEALQSKAEELVEELIRVVKE